MSAVRRASLAAALVAASTSACVAARTERPSADEQQASGALLASIAEAHEEYELPRFYDTSRRFLADFPDHSKVSKVRYDLALQLVTENLRTPTSTQAQEARALLEIQMERAPTVDERFNAALLQLKFAPTARQPKLTEQLLRDFAAHPDSKQVYFFAIHTAVQQQDLAAASRLAERFVARWPEAEEVARYRRIITRHAAAGQPFRIPEVPAEATANKVVLVDFWATWCEPCVAELPRLRRFFKENAARGFTIVGVSIDDEPSPVQAFLTQEKLPWPIVRVGSAVGGFADRSGVDDIPHYFVVDRRGRLVETELMGEALYDRLRALLSAR